MWLESLNQMKKLCGKTTKQISIESQVPEGTLNKLFAGQTKDPQYSTLKAVVHCLGFTVNDLEDEAINVWLNKNVNEKKIKPNDIPMIDRLKSQKTILSTSALEVAIAYEKADFKSKNIARQVLDLPALPNEPPANEASEMIDRRSAV